MTTLFQIAIPALLALSISLISIPIIIKWVNKRGFLALPNHRTSHVLPTPSMGGIGIYLGLFAVLPFVSFQLEIVAILLCVSILFLSGFWDDRYDMNSFVKLAIQLGCATILYGAGFKIDNFHGIMGIHELPLMWSSSITIVFIVGVTNAFNLIDGIDGLAGGISLINSFFFGIIFLMNKQLDYAIIAFAIAGSVFGFLRYNFYSAKIFMGDTGSLFLGLMMSVFMMKTFQTNISTELSISTSIVLIFLPLFDTIRLFGQRILKHKSPFLADHNHIHHLVLRVMPNHLYATLTILFLHGGLLGLTLWGGYIYSHLVLTILIGLLTAIASLFLMGIIAWRIWKKLQKGKKSIKGMLRKNKLLESIL
jgi:UDP-N-acetylmuramyl pentapeptide phosphotransferase/UDP-N-acetylglucosamine-1-phosphate transferase